MFLPLVVIPNFREKENGKVTKPEDRETPSLNTKYEHVILIFHSTINGQHMSINNYNTTILLTEFTNK